MAIDNEISEEELKKLKDNTAELKILLDVKRGEAEPSTLRELIPQVRTRINDLKNSLNSNPSIADKKNIQKKIDSETGWLNILKTELKRISSTKTAPAAIKQSTESPN